MKNWHDESHLECIEMIAADNGWIANEEELSEFFDEYIAPGLIREYGSQDQAAINETFNNWTDGICKEGIIHPLQYDQYCYVGKYSNVRESCTC